MLKPILPGMTVEDARRLFAIGTDRFLISWLDITCVISSMNRIITKAGFTDNLQN